MIHKFVASGDVEERVAALEKYLESLQLHRDSRKGLDGARGEQGLPGRDSTAVGPSGPAGKDADITHVIEQALKRVREEFDAEYKILAEVVRHELKNSGVIDENNVAIPGPAGQKGDSVVGPKGDAGQDGVSVVGPRGRDAKIEIGSVVAGDKASVTLREENGIQFLDVVLPRGERGETGAAGFDGVSNVPGPVGERGIEGQQGIPGVGLSREEIGKLVLSMKQRGSI